MPKYLIIYVSIIIIGLVSLVGMLIYYFKDAQREKIIERVWGIACGAFVFNFLHELLPDTILQVKNNINTLIYIGIGILAFAILEGGIHALTTKKRIINTQNTQINHLFIIILLIGDSLHNFSDGVFIAGRFLTTPTESGISTTIAIALHEIPQELSEWILLLGSGLSFRKTIFLNILSSIFALLGAFVLLNMNIEQHIIETILNPILTTLFGLVIIFILLKIIKRGETLIQNIMYGIFGYLFLYISEYIIEHL